MSKNSRLVYSTDSGRVKQQPNPAETAIGDGKIRIQRQTKGRKGKGVSLITGLPLNAAELAILAKELKKKCGVGGTVKAGVIEIQGDYRDLLLKELIQRGYDAKIAGG